QIRTTDNSVTACTNTPVPDGWIFSYISNMLYSQCAPYQSGTMDRLQYNNFSNPFMCSITTVPAGYVASGVSTGGVISGVCAAYSRYQLEFIQPYFTNMFFCDVPGGVPQGWVVASYGSTTGACAP